MNVELCQIYILYAHLFSIISKLVIFRQLNMNYNHFTFIDRGGRIGFLIASVLLSLAVETREFLNRSPNPDQAPQKLLSGRIRNSREPYVHAPDHFELCYATVLPTLQLLLLVIPLLLTLFMKCWYSFDLCYLITNTSVLLKIVHSTLSN